MFWDGLIAIIQCIQCKTSEKDCLYVLSRCLVTDKIIDPILRFYSFWSNSPVLSLFQARNSSVVQKVCCSSHEFLAGLFIMFLGNLHIIILFYEESNEFFGLVKSIFLKINFLSVFYFPLSSCFSSKNFICRYLQFYFFICNLIRSKYFFLYVVFHGLQFLTAENWWKFLVCFVKRYYTLPKYSILRLF